MPRRLRPQLTIDGLPVVEHDYPQLHPQLLYALFGLTLDGDPYTIAGIERPVAKLAWQVMINAGSRRMAVGALMKRVREKLGRVLTLLEAHAVFEELEQRHEPISQDFYSGAGLGLQCIDSEMLIRVLLRCVSEGFIGLPVHDSLVLPIGREADRGLEIMQEELSITLRKLRGG